MALRILLPINRTFGSMLCFLTYYVAGEPADRKGSIDLSVLQGHQDLTQIYQDVMVYSIYLSYIKYYNIVVMMTSLYSVH